MFKLDPFVVDAKDAGTLPPLEAVRHRFQLPDLEECESSVNRLLNSLKVRTSLTERTEEHQQAHGSPKGKKREVICKEEPAGVDIDEEEDVSFWLEAGENVAGPSKGKLFQPPKSWDTMVDRYPDRDQGSLLSEGSVFTFDALIFTNEPDIDLARLKTQSSRTPSDTAEVLSLLMRATLGSVTTAGVIWVKKENKFRWVPNNGRILGLQRGTTSSAVAIFLNIATCLRRLEIVVDSLSSKPMTPTHHSLIHALSTCLTYIKQELTSAIGESDCLGAATLVGCSRRLDDIREMLHELCDVIQWPLELRRPDPLPSRPSVILDRLYAQLLARISTASPAQGQNRTTLTLAYIMTRASQPLLALLHQWVGLADSSTPDEDTDPESQPWGDLGITRSTSLYGGTRGNKWDYSFSSSKMPRFVPRSDRRVLFEAGKNLRLLRDASEGHHPLCASNWGLSGDWGWGQNPGAADNLALHSRRINREIEHWRRSTRGIPKSLSTASSFPQLRTPHKVRKKLPSNFMDVSPTKLDENDPADIKSYTTNNEFKHDVFWSLLDQEPGAHFARANVSLWSPTPLAELETFIAHHSLPSNTLLSESAPTLPRHISASLLAPLLVHADLISTSLVTHYLDDLALIDHLDVLRAHWLGGDVAYLERVNAALFGKDAAGAGEALGLGKRARTRARLGLGNDDMDNDKGEEQREWGIGLGIGLSERAKWPPGGAELTYALRSAVVDDERSGAVSEVWENIEDKVSYAIKDLPEDQRDGRRARWLNPQAIEALDFLYLAYSPPPAIAVVLPPSLMAKYQSIHNLLLRLGRIQTVLRSLFIDTHHQYDISEEPTKIGVDAHHFRSSRTRDATQKYKRGIFLAGSKHETKLWRLRYRMSHFITTFTRYLLDIAIGANWEVLRKRLKKLQRKNRYGPGTDSRPSTPATDSEETDDYFNMHNPDLLGGEVEDDDDSEATHHGVHQLHSINSLILYHQLIVDRILRSCLLSPSAGHQVVYKVLMTLFGLVLDFGKTVKEVEKGLLGWEDGAEQIDGYWKEWVEKETVFLHAVERLSMRTTSEKTATQDQENQVETDRDLEILLQGERDDVDEGRPTRQGADLQELVLRIRLQSVQSVGSGHHKEANDGV